MIGKWLAASQKIRIGKWLVEQYNKLKYKQDL